MKTIQLEGREWMTVAEAAQVAGVEPVTIYKSIDRGHLTKARLLDTLVIVPVDEVLARWPTEPEAEVGDARRTV